MLNRRYALGVLGFGALGVVAGSRLPLSESGSVTVPGVVPTPARVPTPEPDPAVLLQRDSWVVETGAGGWGNHELQTYTDDAVRFADDGAIAITARVHGSGPDASCTSGRITTAGRFSFREGTLTARIRLPEGQGLLPAFWLLGDSLATKGWPACGEIDVVETPNETRHSVHSLHGPRRGDGQPWHLSRGIDQKAPLSRDFHEYAVQRSKGRIVVLLDDEVVLDRHRAQVKKARWVFDKPFHVVLSLAVGGDWPGPPDRTTPRRSVMEVASVRYDPDLLPD